MAVKVSASCSVFKMPRRSFFYPCFPVHLLGEGGGFAADMVTGLPLFRFVFFNMDFHPVIRALLLPQISSSGFP